jgi:hypothetical protein
MTPRMRKRTALVATTLVWAAGLASAAALAHVLQPPVPPPAEFKLEVAAPAVDTAPAEMVQAARKVAVIEIPTVTIRSLRAPPQVVAPKHLDISEMRCRPWRDLDMGSGQVQVCD